MRFAQTEEQKMFRDSVAAVVSRSSKPADVREAWELDAVERPAVWEALVATGFPTLLTPEELGGGGSERELTAALDELGRAAAPGPLVEHAAVAVPLLAELAPSVLETVLDEGQLMTATAGSVVPYAAMSDSALVLRGDTIHRVALDAQSETPAAAAFDKSRQAATLPDEALGETTVLASGPQVAAAVARAEDRAALGTASFLLGLASSMIDATVTYDTMRTQFGVSIGSFQAVKHQLANAYIAVEFARPVVDAAAMAMSASSPDAPRLCSMAKALAGDAGRITAKAALQCHGAIGYTMEADLHLHLMRTWSLLNAWGSVDHHRDRVADMVLGVGV
ncbi:acyl-CoA dehydrogenase family protein [Rhodococcus sp. IEGM 1305]|uniref:acyl-CoA dehydrogenase family protein n=1 Tax=Rhodococcus sp. IEGM 1305 TaxID=3047092 RepID=UPI0024B87675|nr:acyl-CoA dehydrogenase family protein [Rhodococcus sp. IEGM 1305]MDI9953299.1 acyl-CoA dehydrogenase family protein [Rhodococcus sp. IEGM 1305]